ncbi:MAG: rod shape-determining protein [Lachnospiraceae bacterium]|nr:rod shape-determining protein [Lachnospiraceae bacterium]
MAAELKEQGELVFGLDIGTRSIVGTVGYREADVFYVEAQVTKEHETRAMLDGQIHDIGQVGKTIASVKKELEKKLGIRLSDVCIAAAGRVLRTVETKVTWDLDKERVITQDEIAGLTSMGMEQAYAQFQESNDTGMKFYCVGNSVIRYYLNGYQIGNLENHKARSIGADIIATFLPDEVVDGLYKAVEIAGLKVANLTLEPIAAIEVAIPEMYRMLNIALVDVGAGTSDICITKDGCIIAYGMIPCAGDQLTEKIARECLVDFATAEKIKKGIKTRKTVDYKDIMGLSHKIEREAVLQMLDETVADMTLQVSEKIKELNGGKSVSAVFIVGGGGKIAGYDAKLAKHLDILEERVALRGEEVMQRIIYREKTKKDSLLVTPVGICLNYYEQTNSFIYVTFNEERIKLYDNNSLTVMTAAMHANFPNDGLFPKRGKEINYTINGVKKICRGELGEAAKILLNGEAADMNTPIRSNDVILVEESTAGKPAKLPLAKLPEFKSAISVTVNGSKILLPKFAMVGGEIKTQYYEVQNGDAVEMLNYYTVSQVKEFMDVILDDSMAVYVNNELAGDDTQVYDNFTIKWALKPANGTDLSAKDLPEESDAEETVKEDAREKNGNIAIGIIVNSKPVTLTGKPSYIFVDVFDFIDFDLKNVQGKSVVTLIDGRNADFVEPLYEGAKIDIYWEK